MKMSRRASAAFDKAIERDNQWFAANPIARSRRRKVDPAELPRRMRGRGIKTVEIGRAGPSRFVRTFLNAEGRPVFSGIDFYDDPIVPLAPEHPISIERNGENGEIKKVFVNRDPVAVADREWFEQHPGASEVHRAATEDELQSLAPDADVDRFVGVTTVREISPGIRTRAVTYIVDLGD
jgi:hypothetical protein